MALASEDDFLALIQKHFPESSGHVQLGRGDDCAVLNFPPTACMSVDIFLEDIHFRRSYFSPRDIGYKALAVNVSDIYGMGAKPLGFCLGLSGPLHKDEPYWDDLLAGMSAFAREAGVVLVGGDLSRSDKTGLCITIWGEEYPDGRFMRRGNTQVGDVLFVAGDIGLARAGLLSLEKEGNGAVQKYPDAVRAHLRPRLSPDAARDLSCMSAVRGLMDVSDGLVRDVPRFMAQGQGADFCLAESALSGDVLRYCKNRQCDPVEFALLGGEDYSLLGACSPGVWEDVKQSISGLLQVGVVTEIPGLYIKSKPMERQGFDHFTETSK